MRHTLLVITVLMSSISYASEIVKKEPKRGVLIAIEGIDGSGKSTLANHLYNALREEYTQVFLTQEPGGTEIGKKISELVQTQTIPLDPNAEFFLFVAARAQHVKEIITPRLKEKDIIICDRFTDSSLAYQGYGRDLDKDLINTTNALVTNGIKPDLTIFVEISSEIALKRIKKRNSPKSIFEKETLLPKVAKGFEEIFSPKNNYPNKFIIVQGKDSEKEVAQQTINIVQNWLKNDLKI